MSGYRMGLEGPLLDYACKKYTPDNVIQELMAQYEEDLQIKRKRKLQKRN
jgi:hypothetical protein